MKKVFFSLFSLALIGAGCTGLGGGKAVQGEWTIAFDLPNDWVMVMPYQPADTPINLDGDIEPTDSEVVLQSTSQHILSGTVAIDEGREELFGDYLTTDDSWLKVSVLKLDARRVIPSESEDLGDGFYKESDEVYYFKTDDANYKFTILASNADTQEAVDVIMTAQVVEETLE